MFDKTIAALILFFLFVLPRPALATPVQPATVSASVENYDQLVSAIRKARATSRERIEKLVEAEKVREAWEIGKLIDTHVLQHKERADYGKQVLKRLASDLDISQTELSFMLQFARAYPNHSPANKLSWSHYRELLSINDAGGRENLAEQAEKEGWSRDRLRDEIRRRKRANERAAEQAPAVEILTAEPGTPGTYKVVKANYGSEPDTLVIDLGFSNYYRPQKFKFREGDYVTEEHGKARKTKDVNDRDLFTYTGSVIRVIDGDTFVASIDLGFGFTTVQTLRLRGLDAPEIISSEGREAKEFLEDKLGLSKAISESEIASLRAPRVARNDILIRTSKSDKYDRYLADVFVDDEYVNQTLIEEGHAQPAHD